MRGLGITLIAIAVLALVALWFSALFELPGLMSLASRAYMASPIFLVIGILLVAFGGRRASPRGRR